MDETDDLKRLRTKNYHLACALVAVGFGTPSSEPDETARERTKPKSIFSFWYRPEQETELQGLIRDWRAGNPQTRMGLLKRYRQATVQLRSSAWADRSERGS